MSLTNSRTSVINVTVGSDPELFLRSRTTGQPLSAIGRVGGTKEHPQKVFRGALQEDGVAAEINTDPAKNAKEFIINLEAVLQALQGVVGEDVELVMESHITLPDAELKGDAAWMIGCDPDFNAWTGERNRPPLGYDDGRRMAGGHVHIGYPNPNKETSFLLAQMCDYLLGLPSLLEEPDVTRRTMYGKAGSCRIKSYGVEYRALGNFWLKTPKLMEWVFNQSVLAYELLPHLEAFKEHMPMELLHDLINNGAPRSVIQSYTADIRNLIDRINNGGV